MSKCYSCPSRRDIPGDAHSQCQAGMAGLFNGGVRMPQVQGNAHGIKMGWFLWPFNYDPVWLESCSYVDVKETA
jgi:hypothetical protein